MKFGVRIFLSHIMLVDRSGWRHDNNLRPNCSW